MTPDESNESKNTPTQVNASNESLNSSQKVVDAALGTVALGCGELAAHVEKGVAAIFNEESEILGAAMGKVQSAPLKIGAQAANLGRNIAKAGGNVKEGIEQTAKDYLLDVIADKAMSRATTEAISGHVALIVGVSNILTPFTDILADTVHHEQQHLLEVMKKENIRPSMDGGPEDWGLLLEAFCHMPRLIVAMETVVKDGIEQTGNVIGAAVFGKTSKVDVTKDTVSPSSSNAQKVTADAGANDSTQTSMQPEVALAIEYNQGGMVKPKQPTQPEFAVSVNIDDKETSVTLSGKQSDVSPKIDEVSGSATLSVAAGVGIVAAASVSMVMSDVTLTAGASTSGAGFVSGSVAVSSTAVVAAVGAVAVAAVVAVTVYGSVKHIHKKREAHLPPFFDFDSHEDKKLSMALYNVGKNSSKENLAELKKWLPKCRALETTDEKQSVLDIISFVAENPTSENIAILNSAYSKEHAYKQLNFDIFFQLSEKLFEHDVRAFRLACEAGDTIEAYALCGQLLNKYPDNTSLVEAQSNLFQQIKQDTLNSKNPPNNIPSSIPDAVQPDNLKVIILSGYKEVLEYYQKNSSAIRDNPEILKQFEELLNAEVTQAASNNDFNTINELQRHLSVGNDFPTINVLCEKVNLNGQLCAGLAIENMAEIAGSYAKTIEEKETRQTVVAACGMGEIGGKIVAGVARCKLIIIELKGTLLTELSKESTTGERKTEITNRLSELEHQYGVLSDSTACYMVSSILDTIKRYHENIYEIDPKKQAEYNKYWEYLSATTSALGTALDIRNNTVSANTVGAGAKVAVALDTASDYFFGASFNLRENALVTKGIPMAIGAGVSGYTLSQGVAVIDPSLSLVAIGIRSTSMAVTYFLPPEEVGKIIAKGEYLAENSWVSMEAVHEGAKQTADQIQVVLSVKTIAATASTGASWLYTTAGAAATAVLPTVVTTTATAFGGAVASSAAATGAAIMAGATTVGTVVATTATTIGTSIVAVLPTAVTTTVATTSATVVAGATAAGTAVVTSATAIGTAAASAPALAAAGGTALAATALTGFNAGYKQADINTRNTLLNTAIADNKGDHDLALEKIDGLRKGKDFSNVITSEALEEQKLSIQVKSALKKDPRKLLVLELEILQFMQKNPTRTLLKTYLLRCQEYRYSLSPLHITLAWISEQEDLIKLDQTSQLLEKIIADNPSLQLPKQDLLLIYLLKAERYEKNKMTREYDVELNKATYIFKVIKQPLDTAAEDEYKSVRVFIESQKNNKIFSRILEKEKESNYAAGALSIVSLSSGFFKAAGGLNTDRRNNPTTARTTRYDGPIIIRSLNPAIIQKHFKPGFNLVNNKFYKFKPDIAAKAGLLGFFAIGLSVAGSLFYTKGQASKNGSQGYVKDNNSGSCRL